MEKDRNRKRQQRVDGSSYALVSDYQLRQREIKRAWLCEYLSVHPCVDCGESDIVVLELDHTGEEKKTGEISRILNGTSSLRRLQEEVAKCVTRCCNCHRRKTVERLGGSYRTAYQAEN